MPLTHIRVLTSNILSRTFATRMRSTTTRLPAVITYVVACLCLSSVLEARDCPHGWAPGLGQDGVVGTVLSICAYDDDDGGPHSPELYIGGGFSSIDGIAATGIARWDGQTWSALGTPANNYGVDNSNWAVTSMAVFDDDGPGPILPALYVAGNFAYMNGVFCNHIARWDGTTWTALPSGFVGVSGDILTLAVFDADGPGPGTAELYIGGNVFNAGGVAANNIAKWNGSTYSALIAPGGNGVSNTVNALCVWDEDGTGPGLPVLVAAGHFATAGGITANRIAKWNGANWGAFAGPSGTGVDNTVYAVCAYDEDGGGPNPPRLFAGGTFLSAGGVSVNRIARWDSSAWSILSGPGGTNGVTGATGVRVLSVVDPDGSAPMTASLLIGGGFSSAAGVSVNNAALWNGSVASPLIGSGGNGVGGIAHCAGQFDIDGAGPLESMPLVGGRFSKVDSTLYSAGVAGWNGASWFSFFDDLPSVIYGHTINVLASVDLDGPGGNPASVYAAGSFGIQPSVSGLGNIGRWDGANWSSVGGAISNNEAYALASFDDDGPGPHSTELYVGGLLDSVAGVPNTEWIAKWNGSAWSSLGNPNLTNRPGALQVYDDDDGGPNLPALYVGGTFSMAGGLPVGRVAKWNGTNWSQPGLGVAAPFLAEVLCMTIHDMDGPGGNIPSLVVGGRFTTAGGNPAENVALWRNNTWSGAATTFSGGIPVVNAVASYDADGAGPANPELYIGGDFAGVNGVTGTSFIAKWNGISWSSVGGGMDMRVYTLSVYDADGAGPQNSLLIAGGDFLNAGGQSTRRIAAWNGTAWSPLDGPNGEGVLDGSVRTLIAHPGPSDSSTLMAGGVFSVAGGISSISFAQWSQPTIAVSSTGSCPPTEITLSISDCTPGAYTYQWQKNGVNLTNGGNISGAQSEALTISPVSGADAGNYAAIVSGSFGQVRSSAYPLVAAIEPPEIVSEPSATNACVGSAVNLNVTALNGTLSYQWRKNGVNLSNGGRISGATSSTLSISPTLLSDTDSYDVLVTNDCGDTPSDSVAVSVQSGPMITTEPVDTAGCAGDSVLLSLSATVVSPVTYQWRKGGINLTNSPPFSGVNTSTLTINPASEFDNDNYDCVIIDACNQTISDEATVTISSSPPILGFGPDPVDTCAGQYVSLAAQGFSSPSPSYQWRKDGDPIDGATDSFIEFLSASPSDTGLYDVVISNGCGDIIPPAVQVNVFATATADGNLDTTANGLDINGLLDALLNWDFVTYSAPYCAYDMNGDLYVDDTDIPGVVAIILGS